MSSFQLSNPPPDKPASGPADARAPKPASDPRDTPAMRQYMAFKKLHPDCLLFFRIGDFYELFDDDAVRASKLLGLTLTQRSAGIPMAGMPFHQLETYLRRLIGMGVRAAVADQLQTPEEAKAAGGASAVIERGISRVLTPGTLVDETLLDDDRPNHLAAVCFPPAGAGGGPELAVIAVAELSTGSFTITSCPANGPALLDELARRQVSELLYAETADNRKPPRLAGILQALGLAGTPQPQWHFRLAEAREAICGQFGVSTLAGFGLDDSDPAIIPAGVLIRYLRQTQAMEAIGGGAGAGSAGGAAGAKPGRVTGRTLGHLQPPRREQTGDRLLLDAASLRSLEIDRTIRTGGGSGGVGGAGGAAGTFASSLDGSLVGVFLGSGAKGCRTAMGKRLLRDWLSRPSASLEVIRGRHHCVASLKEDRRMAAELGEALGEIQDVPRIAARIALARATPRDVVALGRSLGKVVALDAALVNVGAFAGYRRTLAGIRGTLEPLAGRITQTCKEEVPTHLREGGLIRDGVDALLDEARALQTSATDWLTEYQTRLMSEHNIPGLKVGFNKIFGYYIELPKGQATRAPDVFSRRQTLTNAERYVTPELKDFEDKVTTAGARAVQREQQLFDDLCAAAAGCTPAAGEFAAVAAEVDALLCFADKAASRRWVCPEMVEAPALRIRQGRHPVLDDILGSQFVPNDVALGVLAGEDAAPSLALITGPNMAGKSTFIRQTALLVLLAHAGSFIPAEAATIGLTDRIFTRVGADDALHAGQSTFMVEMTETANILHHATANSLVILDEIGRGTSTLDGLSLAWAIAETLAGETGRTGGTRRKKGAPGAASQSAGPRTLFATHYHELTGLEELLPGRVQNLHVAVKEWPAASGAGAAGGGGSAGAGASDGQTQIVFLHRILPGRTDKSYGLHVAKLAGIPDATVRRARQVLESLSVEHEGATKQGAAKVRPAAEANAGQLSLFTEYLPHPALVELKTLDFDALTPLKAFDELRRLKGLLDSNQKPT